jgi:magnesium transporter
MSETTTHPKQEHHLQAVADALQSGTVQQLRRLVNALHPAEIAHVLESLPPAHREIVWELVDSDSDGEVLVHLGDEVRASLIREMDAEALLKATEGLDVDDLADFMQGLPNALIAEALEGMNKQDRHRLEAVLSFPEDTAGGLMNTDVITVRADVSLDVVLRYLRRREGLPDLTDSLIVVNRYDKYLGLLPLSALLVNDPDHTVAEVMERELEGIAAATPATQVAKRFEDRDLISAPVVDAEGTLLGRITVDDVVDVIRDEADHSVLSMAGLNEEEDIFAPVVPSARRRAVWLGVNLLTAFLAAWVIGQFEEALDKIVALAVLMPIVASMGGIAGSQTLTLVIRGLALGQVASSNARWLLAKEVSVGVLNGVIWSLVVAAVAYAWFQDLGIGVIIAIALILNLIAAALAGVTIPILLRRLGIDPALAGSVVLTTVTDVVGFMAFLGLATWFLL